MVENLRSGRRGKMADLLATEFRAQAYKMHVEVLSLRLARLHAAILTFLEADEASKSMAARFLRHELSKAGQHVGST